MQLREVSPRRVVAADSGFIAKGQGASQALLLARRAAILGAPLRLHPAPEPRRPSTRGASDLAAKEQVSCFQAHSIVILRWQCDILAFLPQSTMGSLNFSAPTCMFGPLKAICRPESSSTAAWHQLGHLILHRDLDPRDRLNDFQSFEGWC